MPGLTRTWSFTTRAPFFPSASASHTPPTSTLFQTAVCSYPHAVDVLLSLLTEEQQFRRPNYMQVQSQALVFV